MGDFIKGSALNELPLQIQKGIELHRKIDEYTDQHEVVEESKARLRPQFRKYAPVLSDIYYDYYLAKNWSDYHKQDFRDFTTKVSQFLKENESIFPVRAKQFLSYMLQNDILFNYQYLDGIHLVFQGMSRRATFNSGMEKGADFLRLHEAEFEQEFKAFFPDLVEMTDLWFQENDIK